MGDRETKQKWESTFRCAKRYENEKIKGSSPFSLLYAFWFSLTCLMVSPCLSYGIFKKKLSSIDIFCGVSCFTNLSINYLLFLCSSVYLLIDCYFWYLFSGALWKVKDISQIWYFCGLIYFDNLSMNYLFLSFLFSYS